MKESQKGAKFCPKCGSSSVTFAVFFKPSIWRCLDCGYEGAFVVEDSKLAKTRRHTRMDQNSRGPKLHTSTVYAFTSRELTSTTR